jgi:hypothetical protein
MYACIASCQTDAHPLFEYGCPLRFGNKKRLSTFRFLLARSTTTRTPTVLLEISQDALEHLHATMPELAAKLMRNLRLECGYIDEARDVRDVRVVTGLGHHRTSLAVTGENARPVLGNHFPTKADLAIAVVKHSRETFDADMASLQASGADALTPLRAYLGHRERCIADDGAPFCVAGMLGAEMPACPRKWRWK